METLKENVTLLKTKEDELVKATLAIKELKVSYSARLNSLTDNRKSVEESIKTIKKNIEPTILDLYKTDKTVKKFYGGIGVKDYKTITYDPRKALEFAKEKDMFLQLDKKAFEKVAGSLKLDWVKSDTESKVTYPKTIKLEE